MTTLSILPIYLFLTICWLLFKTNHSISWYPLMAILEVDSHTGIIWTLKQYLYDKFYFLHAQIYILCKKTQYLSDCPLPFYGTMTLHDRRWRPSWILAAILKEFEHLNSVYNISWTFSMLKTYDLLSSLSFLTIYCPFKAKNRISG